MYLCIYHGPGKYAIVFTAWIACSISFSDQLCQRYIQTKLLIHNGGTDELIPNIVFSFFFFACMHVSIDRCCTFGQFSEVMSRGQEPNDSSGHREYMHIYNDMHNILTNISIIL